MKRLVIAALAIGAMAACTKSNVQYEQPGEISLQPVTQKATKAAVDGATYPTGEAYNFKVWAWWGNDEAVVDETYSKFSSLYIDKGTFVHKGNNTWGGNPAYYWPTTGSLVFAGYSPATAGGKFTYTPSTKTFKVEEYVQSNVTTQTKDLMWFDITTDSYNTRKIKEESPVKIISENAGVPVTFKHALSWLTFRFNVTDSGTSEKWRVKEVKLNDIYTKGTGTAVKGTQNVDWNSTETPLAIDVFKKDDGHPIVYQADDNDVNTVDDGGVIVIPQTCTTVTIKFTQQNYAGGSQEQEITLPLNAGNTDGDTWKSGKKYIYTIKFAADEIRIAPSVEAWLSETVDIPVEF